MLTGRALGSIAVLVLLVGLGQAASFPPEVEKEAGEIFHSVMSPFCPGRLLADCPSPNALEMRDAIRQRIASGESPDTIRAELFDTYGEYVRAAPPVRGFDLIAWTVPPLVVAVGAAGLVVWLRRRRRSPGVTPVAGDPGPDLNPEDRARLEAELEDEMRRI